MPDNSDLSIQPPAAVLLERHFALADEAATSAFGVRFAEAIEGVRKALRAQHGNAAFHGLQVQLTGHTGRVRSPTYTLVEPYAVERPDGELELYHFDLYRFTDPAEWADAGFREYFDSGAVCLVEWPQRAGGLLGVPDLVFSLDVDGDGRLLIARAYSESGKACLERC
jgi:tRNA threonylcarbamoyladenosine biosynthesis protein TsaE